jgi:hypothetical protein
VLVPAIVLAALVDGCSRFDGPLASPGPPARSGSTSIATGTTRPVTVDSIDPVAVLGTAERGGILRVVAPTASAVNVGTAEAEVPSAGPAIVGFGPIAVTLACVTRVTLQFVATAPPQLAVALGVYPIAGNHAAMRPGQELVGGLSLLSNRPRGVVAFDGVVGTADITDLFIAYLGNRSFANGTPVPDGDHLTVAIQPESYASFELFGMVTDAASGQSGPTLHVERSC